MFPFRFSSIFKNRWIALFFAANILWFADDVVSSTEAKTKASDPESAQLQALAADRQETLAQVARR